MRPGPEFLRSERWWWLGVFCVVSLGIHIAFLTRSRSLALPAPPPPPVEMEVALEPLPAPVTEAKVEPPEPEPKPKPEPPKEVTPEREPAADAVRKAPPAPRPIVADAGESRRPPLASSIKEPRPPAPEPEPGGNDPNKPQTPLPIGVASGMPDASLDTGEKPAEGVGPTDDERPQIPRSPVAPGAVGAPKYLREARADNSLAGGGSPAPGPVLGGRGGAPGPEAPPEDVVFSGGGAGGTNLPKARASIGGGGGRSILSVENPLAKEAIPEDRPGLGPGRGGGQGAGAGGGVGYARGRGIGTDPNGKHALATLRSKPGSGIGAGRGSGIGTNPPGGGRGTGAELPGTGGTGLGYGRGSGVGIGNGIRPGIGNGSVARSGTGGGGGNRVALNRGIPFGDVSGLLKGDPNGGGGIGGGPGGSGRGLGAQASPGGGDVPVHMVYVLDVSSSMRTGDKIGRAKEALKTALSELKPGDTFNIVLFDTRAYFLSRSMLPATRQNVGQSSFYIDQIIIPPNRGTDLSRALGQALLLDRITHVFILSDGEPKQGITDPDELRGAVLSWNRQKARIVTLALGLGEQFPGIPLLRGLAEDNGGKFSYINLAR